jgi:hypothetical protein
MQRNHKYDKHALFTKFDALRHRFVLVIYIYKHIKTPRREMIHLISLIMSEIVNNGIILKKFIAIDNCYLYELLISDVKDFF